MNEQLSNPFTPESQKPKRSLTELFKSKEKGQSEIDEALGRAIKSSAKVDKLRQRHKDFELKLDAEISDDSYKCIMSLIKIGFSDDDIEQHVKMHRVGIDGSPVPATTPDGNIKVLNLNHMDSLQGVYLPENVKLLKLDGLTTAKGINFPDTVGTLRLNGLKSAEDLNLPSNLHQLDMNVLTSATGLHLPDTLDYVELTSLKSTEGLELPENLRAIGVSSNISDEVSKKFPNVSVDRF